MYKNLKTTYKTNGELVNAPSPKKVHDEISTINKKNTPTIHEY